MTLQQLKYVVTVASKGTISEAAKSLFISQPSLTNAIKELEKEMQITIFYRTNRGIVISSEGDEFLSYARQVIEQTELLEERFLNEKKHEPRFSVSTQHYSFAVDAFVETIQFFGGELYDYTLRETQTNEILEDVGRMKSEVGILYLSENNAEILKRMMVHQNLQFQELFSKKPHVFISKRHPLAEKASIRLEELEEYPYLSFEQGEYNSFYFSEEILSTLDRKKNIKVRDRATLFNLLIGLSGYTVSSGIISEKLNGSEIIARPLESNLTMHIGTIVRKDRQLSRYAKKYLQSLQKNIQQI